MRSVDFPGSHLTDVTWRDCSFADVTVRRTDLTRTRFEECEARELLFFEPLVALDFTRLVISGLDPTKVTGIRVAGGHTKDTSYEPSFVAQTLKACGAPIGADWQYLHPRVQPKHTKLLERLMHAYRRANPVCIDDDNLKKIFDDSDWRRLERLLLEHQIVTKEQRSTSGKPKAFLRRRFLPEQIMAGLHDSPGVDARVRDFWRALESEPAITR